MCSIKIEITYADSMANNEHWTLVYGDGDADHTRHMLYYILYDDFEPFAKCLIYPFVMGCYIPYTVYVNGTIVVMCVKCEILRWFWLQRNTMVAMRAIENVLRSTLHFKFITGQSFSSSKAQINFDWIFTEMYSEWPAIVI